MICRKRTLCLTLFLIAVSVTIFSACKKDKMEGDGKVTMQFSNFFGNQELKLHDKTYITANGDELSISSFKYYISNIELRTSDNTVYKETESYHLLNAEENESLKFVLDKVPSNDFVEISFLIGVDSIRNVSGAQTGALDPAHGMFWTWNSGYIMAQMEGKSPQSTMTGNLVQFHIGGFKGENNTIKKVVLKLPSTLAVEQGKIPVVNIKADASAWFKAPVIDIATTNNCQMPGTCAKLIADNYADMFTVISVNN
jgi:hypothetical protein